MNPNLLFLKTNYEYNINRKFYTNFGALTSLFVYVTVFIVLLYNIRDVL